MHSNTKINYTLETYDRTESGKSWKSKPESTETGVYNREQYQNCTGDDTLRFFRRLGGSETVVRSYTSQGFIPVRITSCDPSGTIKKVRTFTIKGDK
jgi:hypothetical protein